MKLDRYLERIGFEGALGDGFDTVAALHRAHLDAIPYENLEIQLGRENRLDEDAFFDKLVTRRRGGWCYEMNGLLTGMLRSAGFEVVRAGGAVRRDLLGDQAIGNHMVGFVDLERRYVVDVGLCDGPREPFPLEERQWSEGPLHFRLERLDGAWWRFHNHEHGLAASFDFTETPRALAWYQPQCSALQSDEGSLFVGLALSVRRPAKGVHALRDTTRIDVLDGQKQERVIGSEAEYRSSLHEILGSDLGDEAGALWRKVEARARARAEAK